MSIGAAYGSPNSAVEFGEYVGEFDASSGSFPTTNFQGNWFNTTTGGTIDGETFDVGDLLVAVIDDPSTSTFAANWTRIPNATATAVTAIGDLTDVDTTGASDNDMLYRAGGVWIDTAAALQFTGTQLLIPNNGSAAAPDIAFVGDPDTGFYQSSLNAINITVGGALRWQIISDRINAGSGGSAVRIRDVQSTATIPAYTFGGDTDTGIGKNGDDQLSLIAGAVEGFRISETGGIAQALTTVGTAAAPSFSFIGDPDTGFYNSAANRIGVAISGVGQWHFIGGTFAGLTTGAAALVNTVPTATTPSVFPRGNDGDTGIGSAGLDELSFIAGGVEMLRLTEAVGAEQVRLAQTFQDNAAAPSLAFGDGDTGFYESADDVLGVSVAGVRTFGFSGSIFAADQGAGPAMLNEDASSSNPTLVPNQADDDTGIGRDAVDGLALIAGGLDCLRVREIGGARAVGFYTTTPIVQQTGVGVDAASIHAACVALGLFTA